MNGNQTKMDEKRFKDWRTRLDSLLGLQTQSEAASAQNGNGSELSEPQPGPSTAIALIRQGPSTSSSVAISDSEKQIQNDKSLALALSQEEDEIARATPETIFNEMMHQAEMWVADVFRHSIGSFYDKPTLNTKMGDVYERVTEYAQIKYLRKCNEKILALYDNWWKNVYYTTVESLNLTRKNTKIMIETMFKKRFGGLEKRLCREWCIYNSVEEVMDELMEDDPSELGLLKSLGSEWVNFYNDLKLIKATPVYEVICHLKGYEEALVSLVKNDKKFVSTDYYLDQCKHNTRSFKVPSGLYNGTKQKIADAIKHIESRLYEIVETEKATVAAAVEYAVEKYEDAMEKKLDEAKTLSEISNLHEELESNIAIAFSETGEAGFSYAWEFEEMPLKKTLEEKHKLWKSALAAKLAVEKLDSGLNGGAETNPKPDLKKAEAVSGENGAENGPVSFAEASTDEDQLDARPKIGLETSASAARGSNDEHSAALNDDLGDVTEEPVVKNEPDSDSPPPLVRDRDESTDEEQNEPGTSSVASQLSKQTVVQMSNLNPVQSSSGSKNQQPSPEFIKKIKNRGIGIFLSQTKIVYHVEGIALKELSPTFEIPAPEETSASTFSFYQLLTAEAEKIDNDIRIDGQDIKLYNEVPMAYHMSTIREMMQEQLESEQNVTDSFIAIAVPANVSSYSRTRLKLAMELAGMDRSVFVQITTSVAVAYSQKRGIPIDNHHIAVVYVCDGLIEMAIFQVSQNKCTQLAAGINTTVTELTDQCIEDFGSTFKALWCDILARAAGVQETSILCMFAIFEKPTAVQETVQKYSEAIRKQVDSSCKLLFSRDGRPILLGLNSISSFGDSLPNSLIEEVCPWKFVITYLEPERSAHLTDFCSKATTYSSKEEVKVCGKPVKVHRFWHSGGSNEELQLILKPIPPHTTSTFSLLTEITLHPEGILGAACIQKPDEICNPVFVLNHMPPEDVTEAQIQIQLLRSVITQPPFKKSKLELGD